MLRIAVAAGVCLVPAVLHAEEMLQLGPTSYRGVVALAIVSWCAGVIAIVSMFRKTRSAGVREETTLSQTGRLLQSSGWAAFRLVQVAGGIFVVAAIGGAIGLDSRPETPLPAGWKIIRPPQEVSALAFDGRILWAGGTAGLVAIDRGTGEVRPAVAGTPQFRYIRDLLVEPGGVLWVAHGSGISRFARGHWKLYSRNDGMPAASGLALMRDRTGTIWAGTDRGAFRFENGAFAPALVDFSVSTIFQAGDGIIWFGSDDPEAGGLRSLDRGVWRKWATKGRLPHRSVNAVVQDRTGALWFATGFSDAGGAARLDRGVWTSFTRKEGLAGGKVRSVFEDQAGRLWFGSEYDGIAVTDFTRWRILTPDDGLAGLEVKEMLQDSDGVFWLATENGVSRVESAGLDRRAK